MYILCGTSIRKAINGVSKAFPGNALQTNQFHWAVFILGGHQLADIWSSQRKISLHDYPEPGSCSTTENKLRVKDMCKIISSNMNGS